ncbi:MAG TPA: hypothetical protein VKU41_24920 [Polyangiaceae bacterium]|nr:hypothetical protein [Polyangiaceae bacterium]
MRRVWSRVSTVALGLCLVLPFSACSLRQKAGDKCTSNGKYVCLDASGGLLCQNGVLVTLACRGPKGCQGMGASSMCDDDLSAEGDTCALTLNENFACTTDHKKELVCKDGKFVAASTCKGPKACSISGDMIHCDDSIADIGDPCREEPGDANYACTTDRKGEVVCRAGTFQPSNSCRGVKGCWVDGNLVHCDASFAREGDICRPVDNVSCSEDAVTEVKCTPQMKWAKRRDCKRGGCKVKGNEVFCD